MSERAAEQTPEDIARRSRSNFLVSFGALDPARRDALTAVYAFCRVIDDAVDREPDRELASAALESWESELTEAYDGRPMTSVGRRLQHAVRRFDIPRRHLEAVCEGVRMDLDPPHYVTLEELEGYCYKVASAVGLACLPIFGATGREAGVYAVRLGLAMQLTNILRDVRGDALGGRVYLPREILGEEGVEAAWLEGKGPDTAYQPGGPLDRVVQRIAATAREHFAQAAEVLPAEQRAALVAPQIMAAVYQNLLGRIERRGGDLRRAQRLRVPRWRKLLLAWRVRARCRA